MLVEVLDAGEEDRPVLRHLLELYRYDFSEFDDADVDAHGEFGYRYLDHYWTDPERRPLLFRTAGSWFWCLPWSDGRPQRHGGVLRAPQVPPDRRRPRSGTRGSSSVSGPVDGPAATDQLRGDRVLAGRLPHRLPSAPPIPRGSWNSSSSRSDSAYVPIPPRVDAAFPDGGDNAGVRVRAVEVATATAHSPRPRSISIVRDGCLVVTGASSWSTATDRRGSSSMRRCSCRPALRSQWCRARSS